jgi:hypothetical protein
MGDTDRQTGDLINLLSFLKSRLKMKSPLLDMKLSHISSLNCYRPEFYDPRSVILILQFSCNKCAFAVIECF